MWARQSRGSLLKLIRWGCQYGWASSRGQSATNASSCFKGLIPVDNEGAEQEQIVQHALLCDFLCGWMKGKMISQYRPEKCNWESGGVLWMFLHGQAALLIGGSCSLAFADEVSSGEGSRNDGGWSNNAGLQQVEDGSVISNEHTSKWRIFTDNGREFFLQGKLNEAEKFFSSALAEAKKGFGERDPHVASACNNLAELYRIRKLYDKAEPLYLDAISILEEAFGPEDVRVGATCHNVGQFYIVQRRLEEARVCYERALKIKGRILGHGHLDYAETMFHLGTVLYLQGNIKDAEVLIQDSIRILEEGGQGQSYSCIRKLRYLAKIGANMLSLATVKLLNHEQLKKVAAAEAIVELDRAKELLTNSVRIAQNVLDATKHKRNSRNYEQQNANDERTALLVLLQSLKTLARVEMAEQEVHNGEEILLGLEAEKALRQCIHAFKKYGAAASPSTSTELKGEYMSCLRHLSNLITDATKSGDQSRNEEKEILKDEIRHVEAEISSCRT